MQFSVRRIFIEVLMLLTVAVAAGWGGHQATKVYGDTLMLSAQSHLFGLRPAALYAAGLGWGCTDCDAEEFPELHAFFARETPSIPPEAYPESCSQAFRRDFYFYYHFYLIAYMGVLFRLFGISVATIHLGCIFMHVAAMLALFGLFRLTMGRIVALCATLFVALSPAYLLLLPDFRDYGKTPFFLAALLLMGLLLHKPVRPRRLLGLSLLLGVVSGIGYGFREDMLVALPLAVALLLVCVKVDGRWRPLWHMAAILVLLASFLLVVAPLLKGQRDMGGFRMAHTLLAGTTESLENAAAFGYADYDFGFMGLDTPVSASVAAYAQRSGITEPVLCFTREYGRIGNALFFAMTRAFPADMVARALASVESAFRIAEHPFVEPSVLSEPYPTDSAIPKIHAWQKPVNRMLSKYGFLCAVLVLMTAAAYNERQALGITGLLLYFCAYPSLLLEYRHFFHLAFVSVFFAATLAVFCARGVQALVQAVRERRLKPALYATVWGIVAGIMFLVSVVTVSGGAVPVLRSYQELNAEELLARYDTLSLTPLPLTEEQVEDMRVLKLETPIAERLGRMPLEEGRVAAAYLAVRFHPAHRTVVFSLLNTNATFNRPAYIRLNGSGVYFFPVYDFGATPDALFTGLSLHWEDRSLVEGVYLVEDAEYLELWPFIAVPENPADFIPYKTGRLDRFYETCNQELRALFADTPEPVVYAYLDLVRRYPYHAPFAERALAHARRSSDAQLLLQTWTHIGAYMPEQRLRATQWLADRAKAFHESGASQTALVYYRAAREVAPRDLWNLVRIGEIYWEEGHVDEARAAFEEVLRQAPELSYTAAKMDALLLAQGDAVSARTFWESLAEMHPHSGVPHVHLGIHLETLGDLEGAHRAYCTALKHHPDLAPAMYRLGALEIRQGDLDTGMARMHAAAQRDPNLNHAIARSCAEAGNHLAENNRHEEALQAYHTALAIAPDDLWPRVWLGMLYEKMGRDESALDAYLEVLTQAPESPETARKLLALMHRMGMNAEQCRDTWNRILELHPDSRIPRSFLEECEEAADERPSP